MIALIATVIGGLVVGLKAPLFSPVIYLSKFRKDLFLILFFFYCLTLGYELEVSSLYKINPIMVFAVLLPSLLLLDAGLRGEGRGLAGYIIATILLIGFFVKEVFVVAVSLAFFYHFSEDNPKRGVFVSLTSISLLLVGLFFGESMLNLPGASSTQVVFVSGVGVLIILLFWRRV